MADQNQNPSQNSNLKPDQIALAAFIDDMITAKKERHDVELKDEDIPSIKEYLLREVNQSINAHLIRLLSADDQVALDNLLDKNPSDQQLNEFFIKRIPNLQVEVAAALLNFRTAYLFPVEEQIASAVETLEPAAQTAQQPEQQQKTQNSATSQPTTAAKNSFEDFPLPPAPIAPLSTSGDPKKWN